MAKRTTIQSTFVLLELRTAIPNRQLQQRARWQRILDAVEPYAELLPQSAQVRQVRVLDADAGAAV